MRILTIVTIISKGDIGS